MATEIISSRQNKKFAGNKNISFYERKSTTFINRHAIEKFFERDDISRMCPGKKDVITKDGSQKQKRILLGDINDLHKKYESEGGNKKI